MSLSSTFIRRPIGTSLLALAIFLVGAAVWPLLPVASLPQVDFPTILVSARLPGGRRAEARDRTARDGIVIPRALHEKIAAYG